MVVVFLAFWSMQGHRFTSSLGGNGLELVSTSPPRAQRLLAGVLAKIRRREAPHGARRCWRSASCVWRRRWHGPGECVSGV